MTELANFDTPYGNRLKESLLSSAATRAVAQQVQEEEIANLPEGVLDRLIGERARMALMTGPKATPPRWKRVRALVRQMRLGLSATCGVRITAPVPSQRGRRRKGGGYVTGSTGLVFLHPTKGFRRGCTA